MFIGSGIEITQKTTDWTNIISQLIVNNNQACLITCLNNTITVYSLSANDSKIAELTKTQLIQKSL